MKLRAVGKPASVDLLLTYNIRIERDSIDKALR